MLVSTRSSSTDRRLSLDRLQVEELTDDEAVETLVVRHLRLRRVEARDERARHLSACLGMASTDLTQALRSPHPRPDIPRAIEEEGAQRRHSGSADATNGLRQYLSKRVIVELVKEGKQRLDGLG